MNAWPSRILLVAMVSALPFTSSAKGSAPSVPKPGKQMILVRHTTKTPDQVADAVKAYVDEKKWVYLGANKVKQGQVTLVKVCIPAVGAKVWSVGLELSALLPCGNLAVYENAGKTDISMLDPHFMQVLYPSPEVKEASAMAAPLLTEMLDSVAK